MLDRKKSMWGTAVAAVMLGTGLLTAPGVAAQEPSSEGARAAAADCSVGVFTDVEDRSGYMYGTSWINCGRPQAEVQLTVRLYGGGNLLAIHKCDQSAPATSCAATARIYDKWSGKQAWRSVVTGSWPGGRQTKTSSTVHH